MLSCEQSQALHQQHWRQRASGPRLAHVEGVGATAFAERLQCHRSYLGGIEIGSYRRVSPQMFSKIVAALALEDDRAIRLHPFGTAESAP